MEKEDLLHRLEHDTQVFKNKAVKAAFQAVDRKDFIHADYDFEAYEDYSVPTLKGETISQPTTVAFMLELLDAQPGDMVLDIGSGSGWTTALLAHMVGKEGKVFGVEIIPELVEQAKRNLAHYKKLNTEIIPAEKEKGLYKNGPYERIIGSAAFADKESIAELLLQLAPKGVMVIPIGESLFKFEKTAEDELYETEYPGFTFAEYIE